VAQHAGVGKGTIYLHWRTREALFQAVLQRELVAALDEVPAAMRHDPQQVRLHRTTRVHYLAIMRRPLLRALFVGHPEVLGKLAKGLHQGLEARRLAAFEAYLSLLREHGLLRRDLSAAECSYAFHATLEGFLVADSLCAARDDLDLERKAELLAQLARATGAGTGTAPA
jgi:AcrR family transcriptional regulator